MRKRYTQPVVFSILLFLTAQIYLQPPVSAATISNAYRSSTSLTNGSIVSLDQSHTNYVQPANTANSSHLLGVVIGEKDSLLAINPANTTVQVTVAGTLPAEVSTLNGNISPGDLVSVSPLSGFGMKAEAGLPIIGQAQSAFTPDSSGASQVPVKNADGKLERVSVGYINLALNLNGGKIPNPRKLNSLQIFFFNLTGHVVSTLRIVLSLVVAILSLVALGMLIYASIFASIISIGRNPLAKGAILRGLRRVLALAVLLFSVATVTIIFLLN